NFIFRVREFEQMEMEFFVQPGEDERWHEFWINERFRWYTDALGIGAGRLRLRPHDKDELSHYSKATTDIEYEFPFRCGEVELIAPARQVQGLLRPHFRVEYDQTGGHIGRRYRRQDEIGTPFCVTVDFDTLNDRAVTIRERDSMEQERVPIAGLLGRLQERLE